jgi:phosphatidylserine/phosphatidylglycerophosphate/cardiolipin synthase-like enzyme
VEGVGDLRIMQDVGIGVRKIRRIKLHAKMLLADKARAIIGSINLTPGSFDSRREAAIRVEDGDILSRLVKLVHNDWKNARRLDLSDEGLLSDLEKHPRPDDLSHAASGGLE